LVGAWSIRQHSERSNDLLVTASASYAYAIDLLLKVRIGFNYFTSDALEQMSMKQGRKSPVYLYYSHLKSNPQRRQVRIEKENKK
jgi:hypothetical protein